MVIDRLKLYCTIKIFSIFVYLIYFSISNTSLRKLYEYNDNINHDFKLKTELLSKKCLLLLGGSNVRMGLSAEAISIKSCEALNLGINSEGGEFKEYLNWLNHNNFVNKVIYSPAFIWKDSPLIKDNNYLEVEFPNNLFTTIKLSIFPPENTIKFNQFGDQIEYRCHDYFAPFNINTKKFIESSRFINQVIYERIISLRNLTNNNEIFIRVPPVYVKTKIQAEMYTNLMNKRIELLKGLGVKTVGSTIVSTDRSLFCDSFHPNVEGRKEFSKEIRLLQ